VRPLNAARAWLAAACLLAVGFRAGTAAAACGRPDLIDTVPPDKAVDVPPNASLLAHYNISAEYLNEDVVLTPEGSVDEVVKVAFDSTQGLLTFTPPEPLLPGSYTIRWPALRGLNAAAPGRGRIITFTVGTTSDTAAPVFEGLTGVSWDLERRNNDCTDALENRMVFDLDLAPADDDGGRVGLTLVVFQTAGTNLDGGSVPVLTVAMPVAGSHPQVRLPVSEATGHVCFAALARDLTDKTSNGGSHEVCVETTAPPFFRGCSAGTVGGRADRPGGVVGLTLILTMALARARRRRAS
jgi:hypothetical protein